MAEEIAPSPITGFATNERDDWVRLTTQYLKGLDAQIVRLDVQIQQLNNQVRDLTNQRTILQQTMDAVTGKVAVAPKRTVLRPSGKSHGSHRGPALTEEEKEGIRQGVREGLTTAEIGRRVGRATTSVYNIIKREGLTSSK